MKNRELIELLKRLPQDMEVYDYNLNKVDPPIVKTITLWATGPNVDEKTVVYFP